MSKVNALKGMGNVVESQGSAVKTSRSFGRWKREDGTLKKGNIAKDATIAGVGGLALWSIFDPSAGDKIGDATSSIGGAFGNLFGGLFGGLGEGVFSSLLNPYTAVSCCGSCCLSCIAIIVMIMMR